MKWKKLLAALLACSIFTCFGLAGCSHDDDGTPSYNGEANEEGKSNESTDYLIYYTIGSPDPDLDPLERLRTEDHGPHQFRQRL